MPEIKVGKKTVNFETWETEDGATVAYHRSVRELGEALELQVGKPEIQVFPLHGGKFIISAVVPVTDSKGRTWYGVHEAGPDNLDNDIAARYPVRMAVTRAEAQAILEAARPVLVEAGLSSVYADSMISNGKKEQSNNGKASARGNGFRIPGQAGSQRGKGKATPSGGGEVTQAQINLLATLAQKLDMTEQEYLEAAGIDKEEFAALTKAEASRAIEWGKKAVA